MKGGPSLRWRLILLSCSLALVLAVILGTLFHLRSERHALQQLENILETKLDEVITVIASDAAHASLEAFLLIETEFRYTPYDFYYQIAQADGRILLRSANLGAAELPIPVQWNQARPGRVLDIRTVSHEIGARTDNLRLLSERVNFVIGGVPATRIIQTGVALQPFEAALRESTQELVLVAGSGLAAVFFLLWYVTTRALTPVSTMTRKATEISATHLRERLPVTGSGDELDELAAVMNDMLDRLSRSLSQMKHFSSDAAHQLRTPLTRIRGELDLILRHTSSDPHRAQLERIQDELERLSRACSRLLLLARLDQPMTDAALLNDLVDLDQVVSELLEQMAPVAHERGLELRGRVISAPQVRGSRALIIEALLNLLDNAIRYTSAGGAVTLSVEAEADVVRLSVEDTGPGVVDEERDRIFQPFYRGIRATAAPPVEGSGLGLAIVRAIAHAHRGRIDVVSGEPSGSVFRLILPVDRAA